MNEDPFLRSVSFKKLFLAFNLLFVITFFSFNLSGGQDSARLSGWEDLASFSGGQHTISFSGWGNPAPPPQDQPGREKADVDLQIQISADLGKMSRPYHPIILKAATRYEVDPALVKAIIMAESGYDPQAVSSEGATGLMQLMPRTAEALGVEDAFNPEHNVDAGVRYLKQLLEEFNYDVELTLAAYNVGSGMVRRHQGIPPIKTTRDYIKKVFAYYRYYKNETIGKTDSV